MRILFFSHDATRTGAPIMLFRLATLLKENTQIEIEFFFKYGGELLTEFSKFFPTQIVPPYAAETNKFRYFKRKRKEQEFKRLVTKLQSFDVVISNTITNGDLDDYLRLHPKVITYVHELENAVSAYTSSYFVQKVLEHSHHYFAPTHSVKNFLINRYQIPESRITLLPAYIPDSFSTYTTERETIRKKYNWSEADFIIAGIGNGLWTKGPDLFIQSILFAREKNRNIKAVWVGIPADSLEYTRFMYDVKQSGLEDIITVLPPINHPEEILAGVDVFFLSSREESYSLVVLEAAMMQLPVFYFEGCTGPSEFIDSSNGMQLDYNRPDKVSASINYLYNTTEAKINMGKEARGKFLRLMSKDVILKTFFQGIQH